MSVTSAPVSTVSVFGNRSLCFYKMTHDLRDLSNDVGVCAMMCTMTNHFHTHCFGPRSRH